VACLAGSVPWPFSWSIEHRVQLRGSILALPRQLQRVVRRRSHHVSVPLCRRCVGRALRSASPATGELWLELLFTARAPPASNRLRLLRVASVIVLDGSPSLFLSIVVQDPHTRTSIGERDSAGKSRQSFATHESTQALGFEKALDEMSLGDVVRPEDLLHALSLSLRPPNTEFSGEAPCEAQPRPLQLIVLRP
jgi:hypothetical protein